MDSGTNTKRNGFLKANIYIHYHLCLSLFMIALSYGFQTKCCSIRDGGGLGYCAKPKHKGGRGWIYVRVMGMMDLTYCISLYIYIYLYIEREREKTDALDV